MLIIAVRSLILYAMLVLVTRVMGKRQVGELQPFEFVITILIAELSAIPMSHKETPLLNGVVGIFTLLVAHVTLSYLTLESQTLRRLICGVPAVLIENGIIMEDRLRAQRYNINDLLEQLRGEGYPNVADVEFAILETNGKMSVIPKSQNRPVTPADLQLSTEYEGLPLTLVVDGIIDEKSLRRAGLDATWLRTELAKFGISDPKYALFVALDTQGRLLFQAKGMAARAAGEEGGQ